MKGPHRTFRLTLPTRDGEEFAKACKAVAWSALDTGERIMTEDGPDGEAVYLVMASTATSDVGRTPLATLH